MVMFNVLNECVLFRISVSMVPVWLGQDIYKGHFDEFIHEHGKVHCHITPTMKLLKVSSNLNDTEWIQTRKGRFYWLENYSV